MANKRVQYSARPSVCRTLVLCRYSCTSQQTFNLFKSRLDKFWQHQDMIYDFQAELHGTESRSLHSN